VVLCVALFAFCHTNTGDDAMPSPFTELALCLFFFLEFGSVLTTGIVFGLLFLLFFLFAFCGVGSVSLWLAPVKAVFCNPLL